MSNTPGQTIIEMPGFESHLSEAAQAIYKNRPNALDAFGRSRAACYLGKMVLLDHAEDYRNNDVMAKWIERFAALFSHCADNRLIELGMVTEAMLMPLYPVCTKCDQVVQDTALHYCRPEAYKHRVMLLAYSFSRFNREFLNDSLLDEAFQEEGQLPSTTWPDLSRLSGHYVGA